jgi:hypothetical protein
MKRWMMVAVSAVLLAMAGTYAVFAQQDAQTPQRPSATMGQGMMGQGMMGQGDMGPGMMGRSGGMMNRGGPSQGMMGNDGMMPMGGMRGMMAQSMAQSITHEAMVATSDGGVVVWAGNKLMKYDSGLNVVKEVELKVDYETMQQRMQKMMETMPMMRGGMMAGSGRSSGGSATP